MTRQRVHSKRLHAACAALLLLLGAGCDRLGIARSGDPSAQALARADSALARADSALAVATAALARLDTARRDTTLSALAIATPDVVPGVAVAGLDTLVALGDVAANDSVAIAPTATELSALQRSLVVPVEGVQASQLVQSFDDARGGGSRTHHALDIAAPRGTTVRSATGGRLLKLFNSETGGLMVYAADSSERFVLLYGHLDAYAPGLEEGMALRRGQPIGTVGTTGNARGVSHLHFGIHRTKDVSKWWMGMPVDPYGLLKGGR